ncbi:MAG: hypothetical protein GKR77_05285 [Legionellales bacterium]|nr:hypothetical protein [Legionellales bacterium]
MAFLVQLFLLLVVMAGLALSRAMIGVWIAVIGATLLGLWWLAGIPVAWLILLTGVFVVAAVMFAIEPLRRQWISRPIYRYFRRVAPSMRQTEQEALDSGDVWLDRDIFQGRIGWRAFYLLALPQISAEEHIFLS